MARVGDRDPNQPALPLNRQFQFTERGRYRALIKGSEQYEAMDRNSKGMHQVRIALAIEDVILPATTTFAVYAAVGLDRITSG